MPVHFLVIAGTSRKNRRTAHLACISFPFETQSTEYWYDVLLNGSNVTGSTSGGSPVPLAETTTTGGAPAPADTSQFLVSAYQDALVEIQLSQTALQGSRNGRVQAFAQRTIDQHTAMNNEIVQLAQRKNIALPTDISAEQKAEVNRLSALSADQLDREYMRVNVAVHEKDMAAARQQLSAGTDADARMLADMSLPVLKMHLAVAKDIESAINPAAFLSTAYQSGQAEIQMSQLALQKAASAEVRDFAQRMINDHTQANNQIAAIAQQKAAPLPAAPTPEHQAAHAELSTFSGTDFDRAYMDMNAIEHAKAARLFRKQSQDGLDPDVKTLAQSNLPVLEGHLVMAVEMSKAIEPSFLYSAAQSGKAEVRLAHLAVLRTTNDTVRSFAQRMIDEHSATNTQLTQLAQQKGVPLPNEMSPEQSLAFLVLMGFDEQEFDGAFMRYNERLHERAVDLFSLQANQGTDADIRAFAQNTLPLLNAHVALARETGVEETAGLD